MEAGKARREDARLSAEDLDLEAGVISEAGTARLLAVERGLDARVLGKRLPILPGIGQRAELRQ